MTTIHTTRSGMISTISYNEAEKELDVTFNNGGTYRYSNVPKTIFEDLINAESAGKYFLSNIKNKYEYEKI